MAGIDRLAAILLTHAHRDAAGGMAKLRTWWRQQAIPRIPVLAHPSTIAILDARFSRLEHCRFQAIIPREKSDVGPWAIEALEVPHDPRFPTYAWRLEDGETVVVYASDVARPTDELKRFCRDSRLLVADGATYRRRIFSHLRIDKDLPLLCTWDVESIALTQIGRSAPPHQALEGIVQGLCPRARPAYDGLVVSL
jgi:phosphoribosyl 1,2-cyclic phosphodiesterase